MLIGNLESVGINKEQAKAFNDGINKLGMLENMLHVISNLTIGGDGLKGGNYMTGLESDKLINLFIDMEEMAADALDVLDGLKINSIHVTEDSDVSRLNKNQNN